VKFVGFCDVDANRFDKADAEFPGVKHFSDYREMFNTLGDGFMASPAVVGNALILRSKTALYRVE
jgi:hypothetical protein